QTIEMFEAITQTQPEDYQSLEILREAYTKIGRHDDALRTSRKLAEAYFNAGSYSPALQQCEMILTRDPNAPEILAMLGEIEQRLQASGQAIIDKDKSKTTSGLASSLFTRNDGSLIAPTGEGALIDVDPSRGKGLGRTGRGPAIGRLHGFVVLGATIVNCENVAVSLPARFPGLTVHEK